MKTFEQFLELLGGSLELAYRLNIRQQTVESWQRIGIPQKYWDDICELANKPKLVNVPNLYKLNKILAIIEAR